jgi:hypothetical protein
MAMHTIFEEKSQLKTGLGYGIFTSSAPPQGSGWQYGKRPFSSP